MKSLVLGVIASLIAAATPTAGTAAGAAATAGAAPTAGPAPMTVAVATTSPPQGPPNASLVRVIEGRYENRAAGTGNLIGTEHFRLNVHPDGTRCIAIWSNSASRGTQITSNVCVDAAFRPLEAYARYWIGGKYRGSAWIRVNGTRLNLVSEAGAQPGSMDIDVPAAFSLGTHPISADAWHVAALGASTASTATSFTLNPSGDAASPLLGQLVQIPIVRLPDEEVSVPAGRFKARHLRLSGLTDYWATGDDWLVVKSTSGAGERVLVEWRETR
jgi:hypothetical protein